MSQALRDLIFAGMVMALAGTICVIVGNGSGLWVLLLLTMIM